MAFTYNAAANKPEVKRELSGGLGMPHDDDTAQSYRSQVPGVLLAQDPIIRAPVTPPPRREIAFNANEETQVKPKGQEYDRLMKPAAPSGMGMA